MVKVLKIPVITGEQMQEVDRLMVEQYRISLLQMMENAGANLAELCKRYLANRLKGKTILVAVGSGNNGGGGMVAARHLSNRGARVWVVVREQKFRGVPGKQWEILKKLPLQRISGSGALGALEKLQPDLVIDAVIGYGLKGSPQGFHAQLIEALGQLKAPLIALDLPSGLDATSGKIFHPHISADLTLTLALPKIGLFEENARKAVGKLFLADIGIPPSLYQQIGIPVEALFESDTILNLQAPEGLSHPELSPETRESLGTALNKSPTLQCLLLE